jgi:hypothetical protein
MITTTFEMKDELVYFVFDHKQVGDEDTND